MGFSLPTISGQVSYSVTVSQAYTQEQQQLPHKASNSSIPRYILIEGARVVPLA